MNVLKYEREMKVSSSSKSFDFLKPRKPVVVELLRGSVLLEALLVINRNSLTSVMIRVN